MRRPPRLPHLLLLAVLTVLASGCQLRLATGVVVDADGGGRLELLVAMDEELTGTFADADLDPFEGLDDLDGAFAITRESLDGGDALRITSDFASPAELTSRVAELNAGLGDGDPRVLSDVALTVVADGSTTFTARAGLQPPATTGIEAQGLLPDADALARLLAERGRDLVRVEVRLTMPGPVEDAAGGEPGDMVVDGRTVTWDLAPTGLVEIRAEGGPVPDRTLRWALGAGILALVAVGGAVVALRRRS